MESGLLTVIILAILSTCYTNGLTLNDLYPYGTEHGDSMNTGSSLPGVSIQPPINNFVRLSPAGLTVTGYRVRHFGFLAFQNDEDDIFLHLLQSSGDFSSTKVYDRTTNDSELINRAMDQINEGFPNTFCSTSPPTQLIIGTWIDFLKAGSNQGSNFQIVIVTNGSITFGIALYVSVSIASATTGLDSNINGNNIQPDPSFFPFGTDVMDAPNMMLNSNIQGTYIFSLNHIPPDTCNSVCFSCKARLAQLACETMRINGEDVPAFCNN